MGTVATWTAGTTTGATMASEFNKLVNAANSIGNYSYAASSGIPNTATAVSFDTNDFQEGVLTHNATTNNTRFTVSAAGDFMFTAQLQILHNTTGTGSVTAWLRKNGTTPIENSSVIIRMNGVVNTDVLVLQCLVPMLATDYVELMVQASAASEWNLQTTASSGTGATRIPVAPGVIMTIVGFPT